MHELSPIVMLTEFSVYTYLGGEPASILAANMPSILAYLLLTFPLMSCFILSVMASLSSCYNLSLGDMPSLTLLCSSFRRYAGDFVRPLLTFPLAAVLVLLRFVLTLALMTLLASAYPTLLATGEALARGLSSFLS